MTICKKCGEQYITGEKQCPKCAVSVKKNIPAAYRVMLINKRYDEHNGYVPTIIVLIALFAPIFIGIIGLIVAAIVLFIGWALAAKNADVRAECIAELEELGAEEIDGTEFA